MRSLNIISLIALASSTLASPASRSPRTCTDKYRGDVLFGLVDALSNITPGVEAKYLQGLPLKSNAVALFSVNGLPLLPFAVDASTIRVTVLAIRQLLYKAVPVDNPAVTTFTNGTSSMELDTTIGLRVVPLPVNLNANVNYDFDKSDCMIQTVRVLLTVPTEVLGLPVFAAGNLPLDLPKALDLSGTLKGLTV